MGKSARYEYAEHCAEQAAYYDQHLDFPGSYVLGKKLTYYAIHTAFSLIESVTLRHDFNMHEVKLFVNEKNGTTILAFPSGHEIERQSMVDKGGLEDFRYTLIKRLDNPLTELDAIMVELDDLGSDSNINFD